MTMIRRLSELALALYLGLSILLVASGVQAQTTTTFATGFNSPSGIAFDAASNLYIAIVGDNAVSEVTLPASPPPPPPTSRP
ncbi:hypothetical protein [Brevundimonas naejangsanensis]|uniref:hypothetical protein n=1 Tax=Brevundimonas naejangsanensis TaxID=588932 RepID=UPI000ED6FA3D|nr:hypothetical protein [Brevundimonas naejangsanensis]HAC00935.1 hypothetical protein [Brevundimonas sp.]HCW49480.1 hypothetical protein [Brevundimonas sp.]